MTLHRNLRVVAAAAAAAAVGVPVAAAANPGGTVQIGGELVAPAHVSSWQAHAGPTHSPRLVQIGGALVSPESISAWQANASQTRSALSASASDGSGFDWGTASLGMVAALGVALFVGASVYVRRMRLTST
jgi:hypothetical protein